MFLKHQSFVIRIYNHSINLAPIKICPYCCQRLFSSISSHIVHSSVIHPLMSFIYHLSIPMHLHLFIYHQAVCHQVLSSRNKASIQPLGGEGLLLQTLNSFMEVMDDLRYRALHGEAATVMLQCAEPICNTSKRRDKKSFVSMTDG